MGHITSSQRYTISSMLKAGHSVLEISKCIEKDKSSIYRELGRNKDERNGKYKADLAERKCRERHKDKKKQSKFSAKMQEDIEGLLREDYSPEQVVGYCKKAGIECVCHERIYQHIWEDKRKKGTLHSHLRRQGRRYRKRGNAKDNRGLIVGRVGIENRPKEVAERKRFGDIEVDLIIGKHHKQAILTINDRASGMLKMRKVTSKQAKVVGQAIIEELTDWKPYISTITADNGKEFATHKYVAEQLLIDYYFATPYHSWERGSNENLNGLIRQYFPKKTDFTTITHEQIKAVEKKLNQRPRKRFNFENPIFVMDKLLFNQKVAFIT